MKPPEDIKKYFENATLSTNQEKHEAIFEKILNAQQQTNEREPGNSRIKLGRFIMKNPVSKIAIAAIVIIACTLGITMFDKTASVALGDVLAQIQKYQGYFYEMNANAKTTQSVGDETVDTDQEMHGTILISPEHGMKMDMDMYEKNRGEKISQQMYYLFDEKSLLMLMPDQKTYIRMAIDEARIEEAKNQSYDPKTMVEQILKCNYDNLGQKTIDGIKVQGFHTNDPKYQGGVFDNIDITLWVDIQTQLPVQMTMEYEMDTSAHKMSMSGVMDNFQWNVSVDDNEFRPDIPEDYQSPLGDNLKMPDYNKEETAIEGLKLFAEYIGTYPENMNPMSLPSEISKIVTSDTETAKQFQDEIKDLSNEEKAQKLVDIALKIQGAGMFYTNLGQQDKNPAYYGDRVSPGEKAQVLMRWKVSDYDYRVIYGDLTVETIPYETLVQLEQNLPEKVESGN